MVGQAGAAPRAVRRHPVVLDQQALVEDLLERPPHRLDVVAVHRPVGVVVVGPVAHPLAHRGELVDVALHLGPAPGVELGDAVPLDVRLAGEAQLLLHGELDRQAVAVPAGHPGHRVALHGLEPREQVLEGAGLDVVGARRAVGGRRALVEDVGRPAGGLVQAGLEDLVLTPERDHLVVVRRQIHVGGQGLVGHRGTLLRRTVPIWGQTGHSVKGRQPGCRGTTPLGTPLECPLLACVSVLLAPSDAFFRSSEVISLTGARRRACTVPGSLLACHRRYLSSSTPG